MFNELRVTTFCHQMAQDACNLCAHCFYNTHTHTYRQNGDVPHHIITQSQSHRIDAIAVCVAVQIGQRAHSLRMCVRVECTRFVRRRYSRKDFTSNCRWITKFNYRTDDGVSRIIIMLSTTQNAVQCNTLSAHETVGSLIFSVTHFEWPYKNIYSRYIL